MQCPHNSLIVHYILFFNFWDEVSPVLLCRSGQVCVLTRARFRISLLQSLVESIEDIYELDAVMLNSLFRLLKWVAVLDAECLNGG